MAKLIILDSDRCRDLVTAAALNKQLPEVLSPFEDKLLWDLTQRALGGVDAATEEEWRAFELALEGLRKALNGSECVATQAGLVVTPAKVVA
ncbi:hypothetical protein ABI_08850 [Asticcacaulis biprosthecium C19]|uniref:Uncharacterized protein n=1 Tax=Asticcacaulis biprosthecium C19 TaxID=715226 RepID=F4QGC1_9CAUL|nr:hypothetical protein [Asticcacaulis biprosthecium]EGF92449.1 hypothetical protein ABI_08850 [Asticcacaulis biprosthecium C19]